MKLTDLGDGYGHIAVGVDDLEATHQAHKEAGYTVTDLSGLPGKPKCTTSSLIQMAIRLKLSV